ncbi:unnamed protein product [Bursaphelenchus okinawaensis]|uniref:Chaoptin n=1 Tax=Bursaphelenchus okinawaensis TaxID=465554 RepID=A0A811K843_9BILA|nr:unnamed protein product [Bursaphelenchus okinawaensis]CAG9092884.1 unnamed protein product [Bursaphelenchus okinawaensis]
MSSDIFLLILLVVGCVRSCKINPETAFRTCSCNPVGKNLIEVKCVNQDWDRIPSLQRILPLEDRSHVNISKLDIEKSSVSLISSDTFKNHSIQTLTLSNNRIGTLNVNAFRGLEESLQELDLQNNHLTIFPFWAFTFLRNLITLKLHNNQINDLGANLSKENQLKRLKVMHLDGNDISQIGPHSLSGFPINVLTLSSNQIRQLDHSSLPYTLSILDLSKNLLDKIPLKSLKDLQLLTQLDLHENRIRDVVSTSDVEFKNSIKINLASNLISKLTSDSFKSFKRISELDLGMNKITTVNEHAFRGVEKLEKISLAFNHIESLPPNTFFDLNKTLRKLNMAYNELTRIPEALKTLVSLEVLELNNNKITEINNDDVAKFKPTLKILRLDFNCLQEVHPDIFDGMQRIETLDLSNNQIRHLGKMAFGTTNGAAGSLKQLNLAGNKLEHLTDAGIFFYFTTLHYLNLSYNRLTNITSDALGRLSALKVIELKGNKLSEYPKTSMYNLKQLRSIQLSRNLIDELPVQLLEHNREVTELNLKGNNIKTINDQSFHKSVSQNLKWIDLSHNRIEEIGTDAFEGLPALSHVDLNTNQLLHLNPQTFNQLPQLKSLNLENNQINVIHDFAFNQLPTLSHLNLGFNQIESFSENSFQNVSQLEKLSVSHNNLRTFDFNFLNNDIQKLTVLDLSHNQLSYIDLMTSQHKLQHLSLKHNEFEFINNQLFSTSLYLKTIDLSMNSIIEIHVEAFQKATYLKHIFLTDNRLTNIWRDTFANQKKIELLDLSHNFITNVEAGVFGRNNVANINLSFNNLSSIPTKALSSVPSSLLTLELSHNSIRSVERNDFLELTTLETLIISNNRIEIIEANAFAQLSRLRKLDLSGNPITTWHPQALNKISPSLEELNLAATGLFSFPRIPTKNLMILNISHNKVYDIQKEEIESIGNLQVLDLSYNNLVAVHNNITTKLKNLRKLYLNGNPIQKFENYFFEPFSRMQTLELSNMKDLKYLPSPKQFSYLTKLQNLHLYKIPDNVIYNLTSILLSLPPLHTLHIQINGHTLDNQLAEVDSRLLNELMLTGSSLKVINSHLLSKIKRFRLHLMIKHTSLSFIPSNFFSHLKGIRYLSLTLPNNQIETMSELFKHGSPPVLNSHGTILEHLDISENPLTCDCRMKFLNSWIYYTREELKSWPTVKQALKNTKCLNYNNNSDSLWTLYDLTRTDHPRENDNFEERSKNSKPHFSEKPSPPLYCHENGKENKISQLFSSTSASTFTRLLLLITMAFGFLS